MRHGASFKDNLERAAAWLDRASAACVDVAVLPEYWYLPMGEKRENGASPEFEEAREFLVEQSRRNGMLVAGNAPVRDGQKVSNAVVLVSEGREVGLQKKVHPMPLEETWGIAPDDRTDVFEWHSLRVGVLVCADVLHPETARILGVKGAEVVLNPVLSPFKTPDPTKAAREAMMVARCYDNGYYLAKAGGFGKPAGAEVVGRSMICGPEGVLARYADERNEELLTATLSLASLREFRKRHLALPRRRPEAYADLLKNEG